MHPLLYFDHYMSIVDDWEEIVLINYFLRYLWYWNSSILIFRHQGAQINIFDINCDISCTLGRDHLVKITLDCYHICRGRGEGIIIVYAVVDVLINLLTLIF